MAEDHNDGRNPLKEVVVVMVPLVAQGHLNQLLHLSRLVSAYNIPVHFVSTTTHSRQARLRLQGWDLLSATATNLIHFHDFPTPPFTSPPPDPDSPFPFPTHLQPSFNSSLHLRRPLADLVLSLSQTARRVAVVHDSMASYVVQDVELIPNAETYKFCPLSAFRISSWTYLQTLGSSTCPSFPLQSEILSKLPSDDGTSSPEFMEFVRIQESCKSFNVGFIYNSSRAIEGKFLEFLEREEVSRKTKFWAVGPVNPVDENILATESNNRHKFFEWLDKQPMNSVIYVSFGTTTTFSDEQIKELAIGLERSKQRFLWVLRDADKGDVFGDDRRFELPEGFEERVGDRGLVLREWVPQLEILGHPSTGGFMSHCGWNSTMESMSMGVPLATWPMHSEQPINAVFITEVLKIGLVVKDWERREELVTSVTVENVTRKLMASEEGAEIRRRAAEVGVAVRSSVAEGGVSSNELDSFISYIRR